MIPEEGQKSSSYPGKESLFRLSNVQSSRPMITVSNIPHSCQMQKADDKESGTAHGSTP